MGQTSAQKNAMAASKTAQTQAGDAYNTASPIYSELATGTVGLTPEQKANLRTSSMQTNGGGVASAVGQGGLYAARTGNAGAATAALDDAARQASVQNSKDNLAVENEDAEVARQNQKLGLSGLSGIYDEGNSTGVNYLNDYNNASPSFLSQLGTAAVGNAMGFGSKFGAKRLGF